MIDGSVAALCASIRYDHGLAAAERVDFGVLGKPPKLLFGKGELAVDRNFEDAARTLNEFDLGAVFLFQSCLRTEGSWKVVSGNAVFDSDLHRHRPSSQTNG